MAGRLQIGNQNEFRKQKGKYMSNRKTTDNMVTILKSIFVCMGVLFFFCLLGKEKIFAERKMEWSFEIYQSEGVEYADLTGYEKEERDKITIPQYVQDKMGNSYLVGRITSITGKQPDSEIKSIYIPQEIQQITLGQRCFAFCEALKEVEIACKVQVEEGAFLGCENLEKIQYKKGLCALGFSLDTFAGCGKLADIIVSGGKIQCEGGVFDSIPGDVSLTLEDTVELQVKEDFTRGNVNLACYHHISAREDTELVVKNGYFYCPEAVTEHLTFLPKGKLYAITTSPVFLENKEISTDIVSGIEVGKVRNTSFFVANDKEKEISAKDLKMVTDGKEDTIKVIYYAPKGKINGYVGQWQDKEEETSYSKGAILLCDPLKAGKMQCPIIRYSGKQCVLEEIQGHNDLPASMDIQLAEGAKLIEGMGTETVSNQLLITVWFENGAYRELLSKEDYQVSINEHGYLVQGMENYLLVTVQKDYEITGKLSGVEAVKKQVVSGSAIYTGSTTKGVGTILEGTKPDLKDFSIMVLYDNGEKEYLQNPSITLLFDKVLLGEQEYSIVCEGCKLTVKMTGVQDCVQSIKAAYMDAWVPVGECLDTEKVQMKLIRESGKQEDVSSFIMDEYPVCEGENFINLSYTGNLPFVPSCKKTVELVVFGVQKDEITTNVYLKREDLEFMPTSVIDASLFEVRQTYKGKSVVVEEPDISILSYELMIGENILQVQYQGNVYPVSVWVKEPFPFHTQEPENPVLVTPAPKPEFIGKISIAGKGKLKFQSNGKTVYKIYEKNPMEIVFSTQRIKKIQWQLVLKGHNYKKTAWKNLNGNIWRYRENVINGVLYIQVTDENGIARIKKTNGFTIDRKKPTLNIESNKTYKKGVCIKATDKESGIKKIILNGKKIANKKKITEKGNYQVVVWDKAGNYIKRQFCIK